MLDFNNIESHSAIEKNSLQKKVLAFRQEIRYLILYRIHPHYHDYLQHSFELRKLLAAAYNEDFIFMIDSVDAALLQPIKNRLQQYSHNVTLDKKEALRQRIAHLIIYKLDPDTSFYQAYSIELYQLLYLTSPESNGDHFLQKYEEKVADFENKLSVYGKEMEIVNDHVNYDLINQRSHAQAYIENIMLYRISPHEMDYIAISKVLRNYFKFVIQYVGGSDGVEELQNSIENNKNMLLNIDDNIKNMFLNQIQKLREDIEKTILNLPVKHVSFRDWSLKLYKLLDLTQCYCLHSSITELKEKYKMAKEQFEEFTLLYQSVGYTPKFSEKENTPYVHSAISDSVYTLPTSKL